MGNPKKIKFSKRIGTKLFAIIFFSFAISVSIAAGSLWLGSKSMINQVLDDNTRTSMGALLEKAESMKASSLDIAVELAADEDMKRAVESGDAEEIIRTANEVLHKLKSDTEFVTISDANGGALARTHSEKRGDSVINQKNIIEALKGNTSSYIEQGTEVRLSVRSSAPVKNAAGQILGAVSTGYKLDNPKFIDELKRLTGAEITVFVGDERINTTIERDGVRQVGTKLNPAIAEIVLGQQKSHYVETDILGKPYHAGYEPIIADGTAMGIFFVGMPIERVRQLEATFALTAVLLILGLGVVTLLVSRAITQKMIVTPVLRISEAASHLAVGNLDIGNLSHRAEDEIGQMTSSIRDMAHVLGGLISDMEHMAKSHSDGDMDAVIHESDFNGAYKDVATGINSMVGSYVQHMQDISYVIREFGDGDFNAEYALLPGKKAMSNQVVEDLRKNLKDINKEIEHLSESALAGRLDVRANTVNAHGDWEKLLNSLNAVIDAIIAPINEASEVLHAMSEGNLSVKVMGDYKGDFKIIKDSLNSTQAAISSYISEISKVLSEMSNQNLNVRIDREYIGDFSIIKNSINMIIDTFNRVLSNINASSEQVAIGSKQIANSSTSLAHGASEQASAVEELSAIVEQVAEQTDRNANAANKANELALDTKNYAEKEAVMMNEMLSAMEAINQSSQSISKVIKVIEDIAFQTNLLALNAAVEAARAGEHGKGFAVVAEEVRSLALRSQSAVRDTASLIEGSIQRVSEGVSAANGTSKGLGEIVNRVSEVSNYISNIAEASQAQSSNINQIHIGIVQVSQVTQSNTSISEECAASSEELLSQAEMFRGEVSKFTLKKM